MSVDDEAGVGDFVFYQCRAAACGLRFPAAAGAGVTCCARCGGVVTVGAVVAAAPPENIAHENTVRENNAPADVVPLPQQVLVIVDNLRSTYNVGSILRTADGAGLHHVYLCGITPTPDHPKVSKTALGAELSVPWSYHASALALVERLRAEGVCVWAFETLDRADVFRADTVPTDGPLAMVIGNENAGIDPAVLTAADRIVRLPMRGRKRSLNVATAFGAAAYLVTEALAARSLE